MKRLKKFGAIICAIAMIVSSITYYPTSNVSAAKTATSLPKKVIGLVANSKSGSDTIENAIMFAWAGADDPANEAGYDPTVTATVIYIYKDGKQVTKIGNATKGGVVGGLSAGSYTAQAANVNSMIQGGAGTSTNMNANEVIANIALLHLGKKAGEYEFCSPHDTINRSQSTNDAYPTAIHMGLYASHLKFLPHLEALIEALQKKGDEFAHIIKMGRTQLEDAVPMTLGQTFYGFASILRNEIKHLNEAAADFLVVNMGSTAIGTGICSEPGYAEKTIEALKEITGWEVSLADDWVGATSDTSCMVGYMSALKRVAVKINKICNDLRLLASGPRCGFGEINLPARQPGSSIMPGKVNPVIPEVMSQIAFKVMGNELCVTMAGEASQMELNAMEPIMAQCCFESIDLLINGFDTLRTLCIDGITANEEACRNEVKRSIGVVTALNPYIGYDHSTYIAKKAMETGRSVYDLVLEEGILTQEDLDTILDPKNMIKPVKLDIKARK